MRSALPLPDPQSFDAGQRAVYDSILSTRGEISGPFLAWLHSTDLADTAEKLGAFCRLGTSLPLIESEMLILCVAAHFSCTGEQQIHEPIAVRAGLSVEVVDALRERRDPGFAGRMRLIWQVATHLLTDNALTDDVRMQARDALGDKALVELVGIIGYYAMVAYTLNAFDMRL